MWPTGMDVHDTTLLSESSSSSSLFDACYGFVGDDAGFGAALLPASSYSFQDLLAASYDEFTSRVVLGSG